MFRSLDNGRVLYCVDKVVISMAEIQLNLFTESIGCNVNVVKLIAVFEKDQMYKGELNYQRDFRYCY